MHKRATMSGIGQTKKTETTSINLLDTPHSYSVH